MEPSDRTEANLLDVLLDPERRAALRDAMGQEQGSRLPLINHYFDLACTAEDEVRLGAAVLALLEEPDDDELLEPLLGNPVTPDEALWAAYRQGRGIDALGHRRGPRALLEALAEEHAYDEAITSLALFHYASEDDDFFRAFVARHRDSFMLRFNLRRSPLVPDGRRALVADLIAED
jgi:hypothetical protein